MKWEALLAACAVGLLAATVSATEQDDLPSPWFRTGNVTPPSQCRAFVDQARAARFERNLVMRCDGSRSGFMTVMQQIAADDYRGQRVRLSAQVRGDAVANWAGLWMRVDGDPGRVLAFDNMHERGLKGTFDWRSASVVLDVSPEAKVIAFGMLQDGDGTTYAGDIALTVVDKGVPLTNTSASNGVIAKKPVNLSFTR